MAKVDNKAVKEKCNVMNDAWVEGAKAVDFNGISQTAFLADIDAAVADDAAIADLESELKMKRDVRDDKYVALNDKRSKVGMGVAGDPAYGNDSPLYGAMGFVRKSEKKSGLTRKTKSPTGTGV
ncbi:MAG: hypothetical protein ACRD6X_06265 [Pyrinomonadaceae bacterium]